MSDIQDTTQRQNQISLNPVETMSKGERERLRQTLTNWTLIERLALSDDRFLIFLKDVTALYNCAQMNGLSDILSEGIHKTLEGCKARGKLWQ